MKKHKAILAYALALMLFTSYVIMDTFFITKVYGDASSGTAGSQTEQTEDASADSQDNTGSRDDNSSEADTLGNSNSGSSGNMHDGSGSKGGGPGKPGGGHGPGGKKHEKKSDSSGSSAGSAADSVQDDQTSTDTEDSTQDSTQASAIGVSAGNYDDGNIKVTLDETRQNDTTIYTAYVEVSSPEYLKTALAQGAYGKNVTEKTSEMAETAGAVLAVNGDFYGAQEKGYVIRNGVLYRNTSLSGQEDLVIYSDGSFGIINESEVTAEDLISAGAQQTLSFGPALVVDGSIAVGENEEVGKATASNPRTAIGIIDENHYVFVVSDGRTDDSAGLSLYELAQYMKSLGAETAYNLDGGGSSTMYFNGRVVNNTTGGRGSSERSVSDIVYIG